MVWYDIGIGVSEQRAQELAGGREDALRYVSYTPPSRVRSPSVVVVLP